MIEDILRENLNLEIGYFNLISGASDDDFRLIDMIKRYMNDYMNYNNLLDSDVINSHARMIERYIKDMKMFKKTGKYPFEINMLHCNFLTRIDYDISLILSVLVARHRFQIMKELHNIDLLPGKTLVIGVGSGIELEFIAGKTEHIEAYDLEINGFVKKRFRGCTFMEKLYRHDTAKYDSIFAIEVLEHLTNPFDLIAEFSRSLNEKGHLIITTAANVPQFDHKYNFKSNEEFERAVKETGFSVCYRKEIMHESNFTGIGAKNTFYILEKEALLC